MKYISKEIICAIPALAIVLSSCGVKSEHQVSPEKHVTKDSGAFNTTENSSQQLLEENVMSALLRTVRPQFHETNGVDKFKAWIMEDIANQDSSHISWHAYTNPDESYGQVKLAGIIGRENLTYFIITKGKRDFLKKEYEWDLPPAASFNSQLNTYMSALRKSDLRRLEWEGNPPDPLFGSIEVESTYGLHAKLLFEIQSSNGALRVTRLAIGKKGSRDITKAYLVIPDQRKWLSPELLIQEQLLNKREKDFPRNK